MSKPPHKTPAPQRPPVVASRQRLALDLSPLVMDHLDRISAALGVPKSQLVVQALLDAMPALMARVEGLHTGKRR